MIDLPTPLELKRDMPLSSRQEQFILASRKKAEETLFENRNRIACIVGPCSIHDASSALEYAEKLKELSQALDRACWIVMRVFCEKPRTKTGWKGLVYDPNLDGTCDLAKGLRVTRALLLALAEMEVPAAMEFLDPLIAPYFDDLITWGFIGARTSASQPHRQLASHLPFPIGFKNTVYGEIQAAVYGIQNAREPHVYFGMGNQGTISTIRSLGNPHTHLVLRGSEKEPNFDALSIAKACHTLKLHGLEERVIVDCSHGNSAKDHRRQSSVFRSVLSQIGAGNRAIRGMMLESHLKSGNQPHKKNLSALDYGRSITDSCIGWEETEELLLNSFLPTSMSSVQN